MSSPDSFLFSAPGNPLGEGLQRFRLENKLTDIVLKVGDKEFHAHKSVLAASSPVLAAQLSEIWLNDSNEKCCELNEEFVHSSIVNDLLGFLYTANVTLTHGNAVGLCVASHFLNVPSLLAASEKYLSERISNENAIEMFFFAEKRQLTTLMGSCFNFILNNSGMIFKDENLDGYTVGELTTMASCMNAYSGPGELAKIKAKEGMYGALIKWTEVNPPNRTPHLSELLGALSFDDLSSKFLANVVAKQSIIRENPACAVLLNDALTKALEKAMKESKQATVDHEKALSESIQAAADREKALKDALRRAILARQEAEASALTIKEQRDRYAQMLQQSKGGYVYNRR